MTIVNPIAHVLKCHSHAHSIAILYPTSVDALHNNFCLNPRAGMSRSQCTPIDIHRLQEIDQLAQVELSEVARPLLLQPGNEAISPKAWERGHFSYSLGMRPFLLQPGNEAISPTAWERDHFSYSLGTRPFLLQPGNEPISPTAWERDHFSYSLGTSPFLLQPGNETKVAEIEELPIPMLTN